MMRKNSLRRLNWVDWVILAVLLAGVLLAAWWFAERRQAATPSNVVQYRICVSAIDPQIAEVSGGWAALIPIDAPVTSANGARSLGRVTNVWEQVHLEAVVQDGAVSFVPREDVTDLYVEIRADAILREGDGVRVGDVRIAAADTGDFRVGGYLASGAQVVLVEVLS